MVQVIHAKDLNEDINMKISEIFTEGFYQWLNYFSKDKTRLAAAFRHMFNRNVFYIGMVDGEVAGIAAINDGTEQTVMLDKKELRKHLGFFVGSFAYIVLKHEFMDKKYPFAFTNGMGYVEFVATAPEFRGQGVASAIINHFKSMPQYSEYLLEVADTNVNAVKLYEKLGFEEFMRVEVKEKDKERSGVNFYVYMRCK